ncbi:hypothetical protein JAB5_30490 [Janthinobacterium sp. HH103]|uniref:hypothetical protein n=1 Tax=unclassified Janthinobacterium TaxID=2610881 RepID=UPI0008738545|nr:MULTISPECIES: hypothetical protein [unclassified Janthinobacterium]OEZ65901.1 hypothetical protein JAB2_32090 [Janthinobacterium sp. HH100]OEZ74857.1 hypothetical protein JAB5_30490 [Janthinobacterium sp. HH103]OEZ97935.1 hypothetical protein JAB9_22890 [Janthinobacterium sp. HH107]QOU73317.1 hypothetical protein JAB4_027720 [Janthinobacterium sp. HH102]
MSGSSLSKRHLALLLSALVFPGSGHFVLQRKARGCLFLVPALVALAIIVRQIMARLDQVMAQIDSGALPLDVQLIMEKVEALSANDGPAMTVAVCVLVACWIGSLIDTFLIKP